MMLLALLAALTALPLAARPFASYISFGVGMAGDVVMTDFEGSQFAESLSIETEMAFWPQDDPWNLVMKLQLQLANNDAMGLRGATKFYDPGAKVYALLRWQPLYKGIALGFGGGMYTPGGRGTPVLPMVVVEPSWLFETGMRINTDGWLRLSVPVSFTFDDGDVYMMAGLSVMLYFC